MHPVVKEIPDSFETDRLLVRATRQGDGKIVFQGIEDSRAELGAWMSWIADVSAEEDAEVYVRQAAADYFLRNRFRMLLLHKTEHELVGSVGLHDVDWRIPSFEIGYWLCTRYAGCGYMTEAVNGITTFAHNVLGARRIAIRLDSENLKSKQVAIRAGYELEAQMNNVYRDSKGRLRHDLVFVKTWSDASPD
jgi:ribosomal-protein-serine acetyltransferase